MSNSFTVTAWNDGSHSKTGSGFGLKIRIPDRDKYFKKNSKSAILYLDGNPKSISVNTEKPSFWSPMCHELLSKSIGEWMIENNVDKWEKGNPPKLTMISLGKNEFRLKK